MSGGRIEWKPRAFAEGLLGIFAGLLSYAMKKRGNQVMVEVFGPLQIPAGNIILKSPLSSPLKGVSGDGRKGAGANEVVLTRLPARVVLE